ncbi:MAG: hypothetical protein Q7S32_03825 [bacterium]|nr:hypothetical protein [bacterium]
MGIAVGIVVGFLMLRLFTHYRLKPRKSLEKVDPRFDPASGELICDRVELERAELIKGEAYLLAACLPEQFDGVEKTKYPVKLGYFRKEKWLGGLPFYLFRCPSCRKFGVDYKHGHHPYLICGDCETHTPFAYFRKLNNVKVPS